jgi:SPP1 family predicted phage head-tail adaptor
MRAGRLRHKISIYSVTKAGGVSGAETLTLVCSPWADIAPMKGKEIQALGGTLSIGSHLITMRYVNGIRADMIAKYAGRRFNFSAPPINVGERNVELQILATESK